jgi:aryl-alcohol dehydrogenase-like predicted oxidoreductase
LSLSVVTFGHGLPEDDVGRTERSEAVKAIRAAYDQGVTFDRYSSAYGQGTSEEIVGEAIKGIPRDNVQILTKFGLSWTGTQGQFFFQSEDNQGNPIDMYRYAGRQRVIQELRRQPAPVGN